MPAIHLKETIFSLSTGSLPTGVAVVRISGSATADVVQAMCKGKRPEPRRATLRVLRDPASDDILDRALVLWFPGPASATGEDCAEFHLHGSRAVVKDVLAALANIDGCRPAEAGEFTQRAYLTGRLDLTAVEGLSDLIAAQTSAQRRQALRQSDGALSELYEGWRSQLLRARAAIEAELDFADEEDIPGSVSDRVWSEMTELRDRIHSHLTDDQRGERLRTGVDIVIAGAPNAGKSSLLNALADEDVAIVTDEAGTTRDLIEVRLDLRGYPATLVDTAGLRETDQRIEREGVRRARARLKSADLILWLVSVEETPSALTELYTELWGHNDATVNVPNLPPVWLIRSKSDLLSSGAHMCHDEEVMDGLSKIERIIALSSQTGMGLTDFVDALGNKVAELCGTGEEPVISRTRHRDALKHCERFISDALTAAEDPLEMRAESLRLASDELARITGRIDVEDILGAIFSEFCVGK